MWCIDKGKVCWPVWLPRDHYLIQEADRRSRLVIPHDDRSPVKVLLLANRIAQELWGKQLSFDQAASHRSAVVIGGSRLPFNAFCMQPGAAGVNMFRNLGSWRRNINYVYPPSPMTGRLLTFLPQTRAKSMVVFPSPEGSKWWSYAVQKHSAGVVKSVSAHGFKIVAFDFSDS